MRQLTLRNLWARKFRLISLLGIIVTGVGFMAGVLVLKDTINKTFEDLFAGTYANASAVVRSKAVFTSDQAGAVRNRLPATLVDRVGTAPSVRAADGIVQTTAQALDRNDKTIGGGGAPTFGYNWAPTPEANPYKLVNGRAPQADGEVVIDRLVAKKGSYAVGDSMKVLTSAGNETFTVSGVATFGTADSSGGATAVLFTTAKAQQLANAPGQFDEIIVVGREGASQTKVRDEVASTIAGTDGNAEVLTAKARADESASDIKKALGFFSTFLLIFAVVAIFVGMFVIFNMFKIVVDQRTREMALLRAIGASSAQVRRSVLLESGVIGLVGSGLGVAFGLAMATLLKGVLKAFGIDIPATGLVLAPRTVVVAVIVGMLTTVVSAWFPARKAAKVPPIAALRDVAIDRAASSVVRAVIGVIMLTVAGLALAVGLIGGTIVLVGLAFVVAILGVAVLGPVLARPISRFIGAPLPAMRGMTGTLARENASRNPRRTSATALALTIGVALVSGVLVMASSIKSSVANTIDKQIAGDYVIQEKGFGQIGFTTKVADQVRSTTGVAYVMQLRFTVALVAGKVQTVEAVDAAKVEAVVNLGRVQGKLTEVTGTKAAVSEKYAKSNALAIGSTLPISFVKGDATFTVASIYEKTELAGSVLVGLDVFDRYTANTNDNVLLIDLVNGTSPASVRPALDAIVSGFPTAEVQDRTEFKQSQAAQVNQLLALIYVLLALAIVIALFGIANTLSLSIHERRRELGLLRAVGQFRSQTRSAVRWESAIIAVFGTLLGLGVGVAFGAAIVKALHKEGITILTLPITGLVIITLLGALAGITASIRPAWRAAKLDVLQALATE